MRKTLLYEQIYPPPHCESVKNLYPLSSQLGNLTLRNLTLNIISQDFSGLGAISMKIFSANISSWGIFEPAKILSWAIRKVLSGKRQVLNILVSRIGGSKFTFKFRVKLIMKAANWCNSTKFSRWNQFRVQQLPRPIFYPQLNSTLLQNWIWKEILWIAFQVKETLYDNFQPQIYKVFPTWRKLLFYPNGVSLGYLFHNSAH